MNGIRAGIRARSVVAVASIALVVGLGCGERAATDASGGSSPTANADVPADSVNRPVADLVGVDSSRLEPPGTPLAPGVQVVDGTRLIGQVFPMVEPAGESEPGWQAALLVDGDPIEAWNEYARQFGVPDGDAVSSCIVSLLGPGPDPALLALDPATVARLTKRLLTEPQIGGENRLSCGLTEGTVDMAMEVGVIGRCESLSEERGCGLRPQAHLLIRVASWLAGGPGSNHRRLADELRAAPEPGSTEPAGAAGAAPQVIPPSLSVDLAPTALPGPGDRIDDGIDAFLERTPFAVPEGGRSLIAPGLVIDCSSGLVAVLSVPVDPAAAVAGFDSARSDDQPIKMRTGADPAGRAWTSGLIGTAGGYYLSVTAVVGPEGSDVFITECGD